MFMISFGHSVNHDQRRHTGRVDGPTIDINKADALELSKGKQTATGCLLQR